MNTNQLETKIPVISTMASGRRPDAWHWRSSDVTQFSSEKLYNILKLSIQTQAEEDVLALQSVRIELERRGQFLHTNHNIKR